MKTIDIEQCLSKKVFVKTYIHSPKLIETTIKNLGYSDEYLFISESDSDFWFLRIMLEDAKFESVNRHCKYDCSYNHHNRSTNTG